MSNVNAGKGSVSHPFVSGAGPASPTHSPAIDFFPVRDLPLDLLDQVAGKLPGKQRVALAVSIGRPYGLRPKIGTQLQQVQRAQMARIASQATTWAEFKNVLGLTAAAGDAGVLTIQSLPPHLRDEPLRDLVKKIPAVPDAERPTAFYALCDAVLAAGPAHDRQLFTALVAHVATLPEPARYPAFQNCLAAIKKMPLDYRITPMVALLEKLGSMSHVSAYPAFVAGCESVATGLPDKHRGRGMKELLARFPALKLQGPQWLEAYSAVAQVIDGLPASDKVSSLVSAMADAVLSKLPRDQLFVAFQTLCPMIEKLPFAERSNLLVDLLSKTDKLSDRILMHELDICRAPVMRLPVEYQAKPLNELISHAGKLMNPSSAAAVASQLVNDIRKLHETHRTEAMGALIVSFIDLPGVTQSAAMDVCLRNMNIAPEEDHASLRDLIKTMSAE